MEHLDGTTLFFGALILSAALATAVWSPVQVLISHFEWRSKHGARPLSPTARAARDAHWERTWRAVAVAVAVTTWPFVTTFAHRGLDLGA